MIQLSALTKRFGERVLLDRVTWQVSDGDRVGLCGPNGAGKTTLLRMLAGLDEPDSGTIVRPTGLTVGYLPQDGLAHAGRTLVDEVSQAFKPLLDAREELTRIEHALAEPTLPEGEHERLLERYHDLSEFFRREEGYSIDLRVTQVLDGLGFARSDANKAVETFSGGWQMRIALATLLLGRPGLLLLDEPTNHLDLDARNWLESYLIAYPHPVILVSHDRYFLDAVVTKVADLSLRTITDYIGTYSFYLTEYDARMNRLRKAKQEQDDEVARMKAFIDRFRYQATKAAQVQSRIKMLDKIEIIEVPPERKHVHFAFPTCPKSGRMVMELTDVRKAYGDLVVFDRLNLHIERGDRIALVAPNGAGKSTLMRMLSGAEAPTSGSCREGHQVVKQYFAQDEATRLDPVKTVYQTLESDAPINMVPMIRNLLGGFLFAGDDIYKKAGVLSGGERTRLAVARMLLRPANTLLLDEPTNHLDLDSKDVLLEALAAFGGTLIFVSHDRYFVDRLATKIIAVGNGGVEVYPGTYAEYLWSKKQRQAAAAAPSPKPATPAANKAAPVAPPASYEHKKRADAEARRRRRADDERRRRVSELEQRIAAHEGKIRDIEAQMSAAGFYDDRTVAEAAVALHKQLMWEVGDLMNRWETLQQSDE
ncbi:MAG: ABC transporter ATP-binding protein [Acidobacteria bacterium]|nr:ABC transporter ATP-binding protein [Acidobacteriota bacterium]